MNEQFLTAARDDVVADGWTFAGGTVSGFGANGSFIVHLTPGDWYIGGTHQKDGDEEIPTLYPLKVSAAETAPDAPKSTVNITMGDFAYTGIEKTIKTGPQVWKFDNTSTQSHHVVMFKTPQLWTTEEVVAWEMAMHTGTPTPDVEEKLSQMQWYGYTALLSPSHTVYTEFDLEPGTYIALCFIMDPTSQMPHMAMGMGLPFAVE
jgi:hypothetical protein